MGGVAPGSPVSAGNTNPAFLDANGDDTALGRIDLANTLPESGATVNNIQREANAVSSYTGKALNAAKDVLPSWVNNDVGLNTNNLFQRGDALTERFNATTGHTHDGTFGEGPQILASVLADVPLKGYVIVGTDLIGVTGGSTDVSTELTGKVPSTGVTVEGVVVTAPMNRIVIRQASGPNENESYVDGFGNIVYGRLTEAALVWTLTYYVDIAGVETAYSFGAASDVRWYYQELFNPMVNPPTYSEYATIPSDNATADVVPATTAVQGKVLLSSLTPSTVGATGSSGTANATVANADHTHQGIRSVKEEVEAVEVFGNISLEGSPNLTIVRSGNKFTFSSLGGTIIEQEIPGGPVNGVNDTFGPLSYTPASDKSVIVFVDGIARKYTDEFTVTGSSITFEPGFIPVAGQTVYAAYATGGVPAPPPVPTGVLQIVDHEVTAGEETLKKFTLAVTPPNPAAVIVDVYGGGARRFNSDYTIVSDEFRWNGYALDGLLLAGNWVRLVYVS
jgi:hypothetical protein